MLPHVIGIGQEKSDHSHASDAMYQIHRTTEIDENFNFIGIPVGSLVNANNFLQGNLGRISALSSVGAIHGSLHLMHPQDALHAIVNPNNILACSSGQSFQDITCSSSFWLGMLMITR